MTNPKMFRVTEFPIGTTAEEMENLLNEMSDSGYYLVRLAGGEANGFRVIWKLRAKE